MPDVKEVYEMVTKQKPSDTGALERQRTRQVRTMRNRKFGAFAVAAAIGLAAVVVIVATRGGQDTNTTVGGRPTETPVEVARRFVDAFGAFNADEALASLAEDADLSGMMDAFGVPNEGTPRDLQLEISLLEAQGYKQMLDSCEETVTYTFGTEVLCSFRSHHIRSDEMGLGPYAGSYLELIVRQGQITRASLYWEIEEFSVQVWEPFAAWVSDTHPKDIEAMYQDETVSAPKLTPTSIRLWERRSREYVEFVNQG